MKTINSIKKIAVLGVGFMGGSLASALKMKYPAIKIAGYARNRSSFLRLKKVKFLDEVKQQLPPLIKDADIVVLAMPVLKIIEYFKKISPWLRGGTLVMDLGSTKGVIHKYASKYLSRKVFFVGCHPLCGSEKSGVEYACGDLYKGETAIITSSAQTQGTKLASKILKGLGMKIIYLTPSLHDKILSQLSHLPHLLSFSLKKKFYRHDFNLKSFQGWLRLAQSSEEVWADIFITNKKYLQQDINRLIQYLNEFKSILDTGKRSRVINFLKR